MTQQQQQQAPQQARKIIDFYAYVVSFASIAPGATGNGSFNIDVDSDFRLEKLTYLAAIAGAAQTRSSWVVPLITVDIKMTGSSRAFSSAPIPIPALFGTGEIPFILPTPKLLGKNTTVSIALANFDAASTYSLYLAFIGTKIFR